MNLLAHRVYTSYMRTLVALLSILCASMICAQTTDGVADSLLLESDDIIIRQAKSAAAKTSIEVGNDALPPPSFSIRTFQEATSRAELGAELMTLYESSDNKVELLDEMMQYYHIVGDVEGQVAMADRIRTTGKYHPTVMKYQSDVLSGVADGSVVVVGGEWDTYPLICRSLAAERQITIISLPALSDPHYRNTTLAAQGITAPELGSAAQMVMELIETNPDRQIHLGLTLPHDVLSSLQDRLYLHGLTMVADVPLPLEAIWEQWRKDMRSSLMSETLAPTKVARLKMNYLPMLAMLYTSASQMGDESTAAEIATQMDRIGQAAGRSKAARDLR